MTTMKDPSETSNLSKIFGCEACGRAWDVQHKEHEEFNFRIPECTNCTDGIRLLVEDPQQVRQTTLISYIDFVAMAHGFGAPQERVEPETIKYLLESRKIVRVEVGGKKGRVKIHTIKLDDGSTLHFNGAIAFKVTRE